VREKNRKGKDIAARINGWKVPADPGLPVPRGSLLRPATFPAKLTGDGGRHRSGDGQVSDGDGERGEGGYGLANAVACPAVREQRAEQQQGHAGGGQQSGGSP
jgi:hypothetical protein